MARRKTRTRRRRRRRGMKLHRGRDMILYPVYLFIAAWLVKLVNVGPEKDRRLIAQILDYAGFVIMIYLAVVNPRYRMIILFVILGLIFIKGLIGFLEKEHVIDATSKYSVLILEIVLIFILISVLRSMLR